MTGWTANTKHKSITEARISAMVEDDANEGMCVACGAEAQGVEPDARKYRCPSCGEPAVFGAEEILLCRLDWLP